MRSIGTVELENEKYVLMIEYQRTITIYYLFSRHHLKDREQLFLGGQISYEERDVLSYTMLPVDQNYLIAALSKKNIGGEMKSYGAYQILLDVVQGIQSSMSYSFKADDIKLDSNNITQTGAFVRDFMARDDMVSVRFRKCGGFVEELDYSAAFLQISFQKAEKHKFPKYKEIALLMSSLSVQDAGTNIYYSNVQSIDYDAVLKAMPDSKWFCEKQEDGLVIYHKKYVSISSTEEFEKEIILGLVNEIKKARQEQSLPVLVSVDTETTGLDIYNIPVDLQSKVVAIPLSYQDDCGFTIFTGMEYFHNVPIEYVKTRIEPFLRRDILKDDEICITTLEGEFSFRRSELFITGHNTMFDVKALRVHDIDIWFDSDTMQMSFTLDPFLTKRKNSLKYITHKLFQCWTPELVDVLGKGNEDKFKFIQDIRLASLYGGGDADFSRLVFKALRQIYQNCEKFHGRDLYKTYCEQDVFLMNVFAGVDYEGIRIDRASFVKEGNKVKQDIEIITKFAHKFVGRFIAANNYIYQLKSAKENNMETSLIPKPDLDHADPFEFEFSGNSLIQTLYYILQYPIFVWTEPPKSKQDGSEAKAFKRRPAVNKMAMKKLMSCVYTEPQNILKEDIKGAGGGVLIKADELNKYKYPVAYLVSLIGPRKKEYESYFKPFVEDSYSDRLCKDSKFSAIDTRRISNPIQTIKGSLKKYMLPHEDTYSMCDFDMSQLELRIMASLALDFSMIERMKDPEVDSHTEVAAAMFYKAAYLISKSERSYAKQVNFGYPYGLMRFSMCEKIFGDTKDESLAKTQKLIEAFESSKHIVVEFLNKVRSNALEEIEIPECLRRYLEIGDNIPVGIVRNLKGFYKLFQLDDLTEKKAARIKRQVGNFPIQSFASELFRIVLMRLYIAFYKEGWIQAGWIKWHMAVHDELLFSFKKKMIHPVHLAKIVHQSCTVSIDGHTNYYIGINIGNNWGECKDDSSELPVYMVNRLIKRWNAGEFYGEVVEEPKLYMANLRKQYISDRIYEVIHDIYPEISTGSVDCQRILEGFKNYTVRKYVYECYAPLWSLKQDEEAFDAHLATWALERFGEKVKFATSKRRVLKLTKDLLKMKTQKNGKEVSVTFEEMFDGKAIEEYDLLLDLDVSSNGEAGEAYYQSVSWDLDSTANPYYIDYSNDSSAKGQSFEETFDLSLGDSFESVRKIRPTEYKNIEVTEKRVKVDLIRKNHAVQIENLLAERNLSKKEGLQIIYSSSIAIVKGSFIKEEHLKDLDQIIELVRGDRNGI